MGALFEKLFLRPLIMYDPQQWSKRLGEKCDKCDKLLTHQRCLSLCNCYYFIHEECFKTDFESQIYDESTDVRCSTCQTTLKLQLEPTFKYGPVITKEKLLKLIIATLIFLIIIAGILVTLSSDLKIQIAVFIIYGEGVILSINLYALFVCIRNIFYRKEIKIHQIGSTKLDIQTSAFKDIDMDTNEEMTKDCLFTGQK